MQQTLQEIVDAATNGETNDEHLRKKLAIVRLGVADRRRRLRLVERVTSLVLLAHAIDDEHDNCDGENEADDGEANTHCNITATDHSHGEANTHCNITATHHSHGKANTHCNNTATHHSHGEANTHCNNTATHHSHGEANTHCNITATHHSHGEANTHCNNTATDRVVSSEISGNLLQSFRKFLEEFFPMSISYFQVQ